MLKGNTILQEILSKVLLGVVDEFVGFSVRPLLLGDGTRCALPATSSGKNGLLPVDDGQEAIGRKAFRDANEDLRGAYQKFRIIARNAKTL